MQRPAYSVDDERAYLARGYWRDDDTLWHWLCRHAAERPEAPAVVSPAGRLTWRALHERVLRVAQGLKDKGIDAGDIVAVQLPNTPEFLLVHLAAARLGAVMCTVHMPYRGAEIEAILAHSGASLFFTSAYPFTELETAAPLPASHPAPDARDAFLLLYTSGTTASPKAVPHPYRTLLGNSRMGAREHGLSQHSKILCAAPLSHLYGLYSLHCAWAVGACSVLLPAYKPDELAQTIERERPSALWAGPAHMAACRNAGLFDRHDWSSLELAIVSGSIAPPALMREVATKLPRCALTQLWGMTELQAGLYTRPSDALERSATSVGRPSPGTELRLAADGELQVRGPLAFSGYYKNDDATRVAFTHDGWFRTGDLAVERDGYFAITGRSKDIINRGGVKFNPADVEALLDAHPQIQQAAIVPMPDAVLGEKACAFVTLRPGCDAPSLDDVVRYLLGREIAKNKLPERLVVIPEMPLTPTRKIIKTKLRPPEQP
ncbi:MAG TPA: class I adenylate-forming enzyme family protein [Burkholderiales bacterium]|nr:class I adenylate-forming enzyme family protein [Burkholderiales bacterium]